jgi:hypothetical protein
MREVPKFCRIAVEGDIFDKTELEDRNKNDCMGRTKKPQSGEKNFTERPQVGSISLHKGTLFMCEGSRSTARPQE